MRRPEWVYVITGLDGDYVVSGLANMISQQHITEILTKISIS